VSAADLQSWRQALQAADSMPALEREASTLLSRRTGTQVRVLLGDGAAQPPGDMPCLLGTRSGPGWAITLHGWEAAPPGPRRVAELFGTVVADAAERVAQGEQIAARERERQLQARLAELGSLAATVAHDIRNPLNIIAMAVATAPPEVRREVASQVGRIAHLSNDLLDYAKPWKLVPQRYDLAAQVRASAGRLPHCTLGPGLQQPLMINGDARRVEQALTNLLENARAASGAEAPVHVHIDAEQRADAVLLHVCDDGQGVPEEIRHRLFEPFASRSPGGTGLGLAIVARTLAAHGGSVALTERPPWTTCFTLSFPLNHANPT
jgi:signal transduction histidine kinase